MRRTCSAEIVLALIKDDIAAGEVVPGQRLGEEDLARRYGVSRTPVREALAILAATGIVERVGTKRKIYRLPQPAAAACCPDCGAADIRRLADIHGTVYFCRTCRHGWEPPVSSAGDGASCR